MMGVVVFGANAQTKGRVEVYDFDSFKLYVYYTNDALVTMEQPLFTDNIAEYNTYLESLNQPVSQRIADYHVGRTDVHDILMAEGMPAFSKGEIYGGMMQNFAHIFGSAITTLPTGKTREVTFGSTQTYAGVSAMQKASSNLPGEDNLAGVAKALY